MEIHVKSAEIRSRLFLKWSYEDHKPGRKDTLTANSDAPIHDDLHNAFQSLLPHLLLLTEQKQKPDVVKQLDLDKPLPEEITNKFKVTGFSTEEKNGETYVKITGVRHLNTGKNLALTMPSTGRGSKEDEYEFFDKMIDAVELIKGEVVAFMEGKQAERSQPEIGFDEDEDFEPEEFEAEQKAKNDFKQMAKDFKKKGVTMEVRTSEDAA
ncbi:MAG: hypothetical protein CMH22_06505 [Methylophaga sp.]|nr:hypothetical protein [Christiangramia sp.]MAX51615.1 hypothetical protein [Methylophaga sp.]|tara:strand:- start:16722 stop:17351 length:630 start_codon:yes stop_codon:yes gene_type:complete